MSALSHADPGELAIASNLDAKPFTPDERKRIAEYLYGEHEWTMARIAEALNVSTATVSGDLRFSTAENPKPKSRGARDQARRGAQAMSRGLWADLVVGGYIATLVLLIVRMAMVWR